MAKFWFSLHIYKTFKASIEAMIPHEKINRCLTDINRCLTDIFKI